MRPVLAALALACAGCASVAPPAPAPPDLGLAKDARFGAVPAVAAPPAKADLHWWRHFDDPQLATWVERTLAANVEVALARERVAQARALLQAARARRGPRVAVDSAATLDLEAGGDAPRLQRSAALALDYDVDLWGGLQAAQRAAAAQVVQQQHLVQGARLAAASLAARAYVEYRAAVLDWRLLTETLALQREVLRIVQVRVDAGLSPLLDRERALADVSAIEAEQAEAKLRMGNAILALQVLTAQPPLLAMASPEAAGPERAELPALSTTPPIVQPLELLRQRPDLRAAEQALVAAAAEVGVARAAVLPQLRLPGALVLGTAGASGGLELVSATLGAALGATLLDGGALAARVEAAGSQLRETELLYRQLLLEALRQVQSALLAQQFTRERIAARLRASLAARAAVEQAQTLYRVGLATFLDVADAQRTALLNQRALLLAQADAVAADVLAFEAMGLIDAPPP